MERKEYETGLLTCKTKLIKILQKKTIKAIMHNFFHTFFFNTIHKLHNLKMSYKNNKTIINIIIFLTGHKNHLHYFSRNLGQI